jgi:uncharacterized protein YqjF (DUF2071 family)
MLASLKDHPFAPVDELIRFIPPCLSLDVYEDKWAFLAVAIVTTQDLRPKGFPSFLGNNFILAGYRVFVRYTTSAGKNLRGLYILKSETNKRKMQLMGNIFTHYNYSTTDIDIAENSAGIVIQSKKSRLNIELDHSTADIPLPKASPFTDWKQARRYAGPLPFTFTYNEQTKEVLIIEGVRNNWTPKPIQVIKEQVGFIDELGVKDIRLANAFVVSDIPYFWKKGKKDTWTPR